MPQTNSIYVAGEWRQGAATVENRNPSDLSDLIGDYGQASAADLDDALAAARVELLLLMLLLRARETATGNGRRSTSAI